MKYQEINAKTIDLWCKDGWQWGKPITHEEYVKAQNGEWAVFLTPTKIVPYDWFRDIRGKKLLGLASGGGQQIPIFAALGARCTVLDYSGSQCESERMVAEREGYDVEEVKPIFKECYRVLKKGGILMCGLDNGMNFIFDDAQTTIQNRLPVNPLKDSQLYEDSVKNDWGIQFSHTLEEQIGGQLEAGFILTNVYEDTNGEGNLHDHNIPSFWATRAVKSV